MALVTIVFFVIIFFTLVLGYALFFKQSNKLLIIAVVFILVFLLLLGFTSFHSITLLNKAENYQQLGPYGDYIGGILNPLIAVFGVFAAGFAFYAQYEANRQVQFQFKEQKQKENLEYKYNKFNFQIQLILAEINNFHLSHYYPFYSKDRPLRPIETDPNYRSPRHIALLNEYDEKLKEYQNSKKYEKRSFEGIMALNELFKLMKNKESFILDEDYFDNSLNNPKVNEVYNILFYFNLTIHDIENNLKDNIDLKQDLISRLFFLYNTKLSAIIKTNLSEFNDEDNLLVIEMGRLSSYFKN